MLTDAIARDGSSDGELTSDLQTSSGSPTHGEFPHVSPAAVQITDEEPFRLEFGGVLPHLDIVYESWGALSAERDNAILVCPSFSAFSHANSHPEDSSHGWWEGLIGPGCAFDTDRYFVLCPSLLGGACGTTGPVSLNPSTGLPYGQDFPTISVRDIVGVHTRLLDRLQIDRLAAVAGGSLGAMQALELAFRYPDRVEKVLAFAGTDRTRPYTAAIHHLGRRTIQLGRMSGDAKLADEGLRLARELGTLFYRSRTEFNQRFSWEPVRHPSREGNTFEVESYLDHQGQKAVGKFNLDAYLVLSLAMDLHDVWKGDQSQEAVLDAVSAEFLNVTAEDDHLVPVDEQRDFHRVLQAAGKTSAWCSLPSIVGHDSFLVEIEKVGKLVAGFLADSADPCQDEAKV